MRIYIHMPGCNWKLDRREQAGDCAVPHFVFCMDGWSILALADTYKAVMP